MKVPLTLASLLEQYILADDETYSPTYLCTFIRDKILGLSVAHSMNQCEIAIRDLFAEYFVINPRQDDNCTLANWFVTTNREESLYSITQIGGEPKFIKNPYNYSREFRIQLMIDILGINPEACLNFTLN